MEIICLSDTHELHRDVDVPDGDLLIYAGDITFFSRRPSVLTDFNDWLGELPHLYKVVIPGNHDTLLEDKANRRKITNAHLLINEGVELGGVKIWGTPVTALDSGAFALPDDIARAAIWARIPSDTDILVSHIPPLGFWTVRQERPNTPVVNPYGIRIDGFARSCTFLGTFIARREATRPSIRTL